MAGWHNCIIEMSTHSETMLTQNNATVGVADTAVQEAPKFELDFKSDEPLPVCPLRKYGSISDAVCEACQ